MGQGQIKIHKLGTNEDEWDHTLFLIINDDTLEYIKKPNWGRLSVLCLLHSIFIRGTCFTSLCLQSLSRPSSFLCQADPGGSESGFGLVPWLDWGGKINSQTSVGDRIGPWAPFTTNLAYFSCPYSHLSNFQILSRHVFPLCLSSLMVWFNSILSFR